MNHAKAINLLIASNEDPVLAAWTYMILELEVSPTPESISPWDAWDAFQQFYDLGLVPGDVFHRTDPERTFFASSAKPRWGEVQGVLINYAATVRDLKEPPSMKNNNRITNPFAEPDDNALASRAPASPAIPAARSARPLAPFGGAAALPTTQTPFGDLGLGAGHRRMDTPFPGGPARTEELPCRDSRDRMSIEGHVLEPEVYCCKRRLELANDGGQIVGPDDLPGGGVSVIDAIFHARCGDCGAVYHVSVGKAIEQDSIR